MSIEIGQMYRDAYPRNGRIRRFVVVDRRSTIYMHSIDCDVEEIGVAVLEPRKRKPSKHIWLAAHRFNGPHARGLVRVK